MMTDLQTQLTLNTVIILFLETTYAHMPYKL